MRSVAHQGGSAVVNFNMQIHAHERKKKQVYYFALRNKLLNKVSLI